MTPRTDLLTASRVDLTLIPAAGYQLARGAMHARGKQNTGGGGGPGTDQPGRAPATRSQQPWPTAGTALNVVGC